MIEVKSPCIRICKLNEEEICLGCGRNIEEIVNWNKFSNEEKIETNFISKKRYLDLMDKLKNKRE